MAGPYRGILKVLSQIRVEIGEVKVLVRSLAKAPGGPVRVVSMSVGLQATVNALKSFRTPAAASEIAAFTGRARAVESSYLNQLWHLGLAEKTKKGRRRLFSVKKVGG